MTDTPNTQQGSGTPPPAAPKPPAKPKATPKEQAKPKPKRAAKPKTKTTAATQLGEEVIPSPPQFDVVGEDGRRLARSWSRDACKELVQRVNAQSDEKLKIVSASPFSSIQIDQG